MQRLFAPSLLRALVSRNVLVSVVALVVVVGVAIYESNQLILAQFADESLILAEVANSEITDTTTSAVRAAQLLASLPTTRELTEAHDREGLITFLLPLKARLQISEMNVADTSGRVNPCAQGAARAQPGAEPV